DTVDSVTGLIVEHEDTHVFFVEVKSVNALADVSSGANAHFQMIRRLEQLSQSRPLPILYDISAIGAHYRIYKLNVRTGVVIPAKKVAAAENIIFGTNPDSNWELNLLKQREQQRYYDLVAETKE
ncbi:hypothetical protein BC830DRAFT_1051456, partial [Chytriomyces sp. MP71]